MAKGNVSVLILGATGMLGHKLYQQLSSEMEVVGTTRCAYEDVSKYGFFEKSRIIPNVNVLDIEGLERTISSVRPEAVINCVGVTSHVSEGQDRSVSVRVNSIFPRELHDICWHAGSRLIHVSTDCVFSGERGGYREDDPPDATDIYGVTKYLGEVTGDGAMTVRCSLIGRELGTANNLVEWFLSNRGRTVDGYSNVVFSGFPTMHFAGVIADIVLNHRDLHDIYHISAEPIDKFKLLSMLREAMSLDICIRECPQFRCDRSLDSSRFRIETGFVPLSWESMVDDFARDARDYERWREH